MWLWIEQEQSGGAGADWAAPCGQESQEDETTDRVGRWAGHVPSSGSRWSPGADTALEGRAGLWGWSQAEARLGNLPTGQGGLAQAWLSTAQVSTKAQHSAKLPGCWQARGKPHFSQPFSHTAHLTAPWERSCTRSWPCARWAHPGLPWAGMGEPAWGRGSQQVLVQPSWLQGGWEAGKADV